MFGSDIIVVEILRFLDCILDHLLGTGRLREFAHGQHVGTALYEFFHFKAYLAEIDIQILQHVGGHAAPLLYESEENMLGADVFVIEPLCLLICQLHDLSGTISKSFVHCIHLSCKIRHALQTASHKCGETSWGCPATISFNFSSGLPP